MQSFRNYFIGSQIEKAVDPLERGRILLCFWFVFPYLITVILSFPSTVLFKNYDVMIFLGCLLILNSAALFSLRFSNSYKITVIVQTIVVLAHAIGNSILASFNLSIVLFIWPVIYTFFLNFILGNRVTLWYIIIFASSVTGLSLVRILDLVPINPLHDQRMAFITGFVLLLASGFLYFFAKIFERTRNEIATLQLTSLESRDNILHMVAHDLRNMISASLGSVDLLNSAIENKDFTAVKKYSNLLERSTENSAAIVNDLLDSASISGSYSNLLLTRTDLGLMLGHLVEQFKPVAANKKIEIDFRQTSNDCIANVDEEKLKRVFSNLVSNAIKFTPNGGKIVIIAGANTNSVTITVKDTGIGIPSEFRDHLFVKFTKASRRGTAGERSTGLGMYIVKSILDVHKAKLNIKSEVNAGSEFIVELPRNLVNA